MTESHLSPKWRSGRRTRTQNVASDGPAERSERRLYSLARFTIFEQNVLRRSPGRLERPAGVGRHPDRHIWGA
jgi:hypothetical protein